MTASALSGQAVLVTGAAKRIGAALARAFHAEGAFVAVHHHNSEKEALALCTELNRVRSDSAIPIRANLLDDAAIGEIIGRVIRVFGRLDVLINNASTFYPTPVGEITHAHWNDLIGTNLKAPLFLSQAAAPHLEQTSGLILNLVDIHAQRPLSKHPVYSIAKAGLAMLTRSLARELGPKIRVNGIAPGPILWPEAGIDPALKDEIISKTSLKRAGSPQDIVKAALFFAKDAPYVTGQILAVDGGRSV